jgi:HlyD family secretion protein
MNKRARMIIPAALAIVAVLVYFAAFHEREASGKLLVSGNIEVTDAQLSFKIPGRLLERLVDEGETVGAGDLIAKLESIDQQLAVKQAEANLSYAQAVLAEIKAGSRPEDIARVRAQVEQARSAAEDLESGSRAQVIANARAQLDRALAGSKAALSQLELAEAEYNRYSELYAEGVISLSEFERVEAQHETAASSYEEAQAAVESAREGLSLWEEGARP